MSIIERIYEELRRAGKKPAELARHIGVTTSQMSAWKTRDTDPPARLMPNICEFLQVPLEYLFTGMEKEPSAEGQLQWYDSSKQPVMLPDEVARLLALRADQALTARIEEVVQGAFEKERRSNSRG